MSENEERARELAGELHKILEENILLDPNLVENKMKRASEIKLEIERMGFLVTWQIGLNPENLTKAEVEVSLFKPKENMNEESQKIYDKWWSGKAGVQLY